MKAQAGEARVRISAVLGHSVGGRFLRVVALGALLVGAAALYSSMSQGEAGSQPASSQIGQPSPPPVYVGSHDPELAELPYDELTKNFFGVDSPGRAMAANGEEDVAKLPYDDLSERFFGIGSSDGVMAVNLDEDVAELPYNELTWELTWNFFGIPYTSSQGVTEEDFDPAEWPYDQLTKHFLGIPLTAK